MCGRLGFCCSGGGDDPSVAEIRPAGNGRGGDGSLASSSPSVGKRDRARGTLSSSAFPFTNGYLGGSFVTTKGPAASCFGSDGKRDSGSVPSNAYLGNGLGGEGSCETGTRVDAGTGAG